MKLELLTPQQWLQQRKHLIAFAIRHSDKRLTLSALRAMRDFSPALLSDGAAGTAVVVAAKDGRIRGLGFALDYGEGGCLFVVHPEARSEGIGSSIAQAMLDRLGSLTCNVAADNPSSMAVCFRAGMKAVSMHKGATGKATLRFERGIRYDSADSRHTDFVSQ